jgi:hypothetical protein
MKISMVPVEPLFLDNLSCVTIVTKATDVPRWLLKAMNILPAVNINTPGEVGVWLELLAYSATFWVGTSKESSLMIRKSTPRWLVRHKRKERESDKDTCNN